MLWVFISSAVAREIVKPQYRHVIMRSSWLGLIGAPHLVQLVIISLGAAGFGGKVGVGIAIVEVATAGTGAGTAAGITGEGIDVEGRDTWGFLFVSTSGLPRTATTPLSVHVLSIHRPSLRRPVKVGPRPAGTVILKENC